MLGGMFVAGGLSLAQYNREAIIGSLHSSLIESYKMGLIKYETLGRDLAFIVDYEKNITIMKERKYSIEVIPSGVLASNFKSLDKTIVKEKLKLPINKKIVLLGATDIRQKFKGFEYAKKALNKLPKDLLIVTFGSGGFLKGEIPQRAVIL